MRARAIFVAASICRPADFGRTEYVLGDFLHHRPEIGLALEADAGGVGQGDAAIDHWAVVGEAAERCEHLRIGFVAAALQADRDVERELVAAVRHAAPR